MHKLATILLAAGQGTRMKSSTPKMLHRLAGRPLIYYSVRAALDAGSSDVIVVVGHGAEAVQRYLTDTFGSSVRTVLQSEQRGTGHAALMAMPELRDAENALILCGDTPLIELSDLRALSAALNEHSESPLALLTCVVADPTGYGRILRDSKRRVIGIREHRDLTSDAERNVTEINTGCYAARVPFLRDALVRLEPNNLQRELYLTDIVEMAGEQGGAIGLPTAAASLEGVNDRVQLAAAEAAMQRRLAERLGRAGVTLRGDARIDDTVEIEPDVVIEAGVILRGRTVVKSGASIDVGSVITDSLIEAGAQILPYTIVTSSRVGPRAKIGPFTHLRPESDIGEEVHLGNFVETKKTVMHARAKANHLSYLGDGEIGEGSNLGAGTIFCNYDGYQKHKTIIGKSVFVGSDSQFIAPLTVGDGAYIATATTVTQDVPPDAVAIGRARQENKVGYASRLRARLNVRAKAK
jgi:bifunctional UDP-N-acetylglucosamine pyrophosphorylase/glucosamine-1-phosphate N-acetyltransferase